MGWWDRTEWDELGLDRGMMAGELAVTDSDECLAHELRERVASSDIHRRWVRAFGHEPSDADVGDVVGAVRRFLQIPGSH